MFERDGQDYFVDMMPALHNYVTIDTEAFLTSGKRGSNPPNREYPTRVFNMCKKMMLESDPGEVDEFGEFDQSAYYFIYQWTQWEILAIFHIFLNFRAQKDTKI